MNTLTQPKQRRSVLLTKEERKALRSFRNDFNTEIECAESIGITRQALQRVFINWSSSPDTVEKIRIAIGVVGNQGLAGATV